MPWWEKLLMAPFALLAYILFGLGAAVIAAVGALVFGVLKAFDGAIEKAGKPKANDKE